MTLEFPRPTRTPIATCSTARVKSDKSVTSGLQAQTGSCDKYCFGFNLHDHPRLTPLVVAYKLVRPRNTNPSVDTRHRTHPQIKPQNQRLKNSFICL